MPLGPICKPTSSLVAVSFLRSFRAKATSGFDFGRCGTRRLVALPDHQNPYADATAIELAEAAFATGSLRRVSYARPNKLFTAHESLFRGVAGSLGEEAHRQVVEAVVKLVRAG
jgi:mRNA interferase MazF